MFVIGVLIGAGLMGVAWFVSTLCALNTIQESQTIQEPQSARPRDALLRLREQWSRRAQTLQTEGDLQECLEAMCLLHGEAAGLDTAIRDLSAVLCHD